MCIFKICLLQQARCFCCHWISLHNCFSFTSQGPIGAAGPPGFPGAPGAKVWTSALTGTFDSEDEMH